MVGSGVPVRRDTAEAACSSRNGYEASTPCRVVVPTWPSSGDGGVLARCSVSVMEQSSVFFGRVDLDRPWEDDAIGV